MKSKGRAARLLIVTLLLVLATLSLADNPPCSTGNTCFLKVPLRPQETTNWCWAATSQMAMEFLGHTVPQCKQANDILNHDHVDCCKAKDGMACNQTGWPDLKRYGFNFSRTPGTPLTWDQLVAQIRGGKPFIYTWAWLGGGKHMKVATGYSVTSSGTRYVSYNNPLEVNVGLASSEPYSAYVSGARYKHWDDFVDIVYAGNIK